MLRLLRESSHRVSVETLSERMGANVYLDTSYMDGGSRFVFEVPVAPEEPEIPTNHNQ